MVTGAGRGEKPFREAGMEVSGLRGSVSVHLQMLDEAVEVPARVG